MKSLFAFGLMLIAVQAFGAERVVTGQVTYTASGNVYTSLGKQDGLEDSTAVIVVSNSDTIATLQVFALSSRSSVCILLKTSREPVVGDKVIAFVADKNAPAIAEVSSPRVESDSLPSETSAFRSLKGRTVKRIVQPAVAINGRISTQYFSTLYDNDAFNIKQPGIALQFSAKARDIPISFEMYGNARRLARGTESPFGGSATSQTRLYRMFLAYDDGKSYAAIGRIIPSYAASVGYVDGAMFSQRFGKMRFGVIAGYDPNNLSQGFSTTSRKFALTGSYIFEGSNPVTYTGAYARTYYGDALDREVASFQANISYWGKIFVFGYTEVDLRKKSGSEYILDPGLTNAYVNVMYRLNNVLSVGVGGNASRPWYAFSLVRDVPDSLLDSKLRGGASAQLNITLPGGVSVSNVYSPRSSDNGGFGNDFSDNASIVFADLFRTGVFIRSSAYVNNNTFSRSVGYGGEIQRNFFGMVDIGIRYQEYSNNIKRFEQKNFSKTIGADVVFAFSRMLSLYTSFDRLQGFGSTSNSFYTELSVRF